MTNRNRVRLSQLSIGLAIALAAAPAFAQNTTSAIGGRLVGADAQPVTGAQVTILHTPSGSVSSATTGADGRFAARGLRVGDFAGDRQIGRGGGGTRRAGNEFAALDLHVLASRFLTI